MINISWNSPIYVCKTVIEETGGVYLGKQNIDTQKRPINLDSWFFDCRLAEKSMHLRQSAELLFHLSE